jgi:hypothetical protein
MLFGIANTQILFQNVINEIFKDMIDCSIIIDSHDILIYSQIIVKHDMLVKKVLGAKS